jgi:hypothetical protein
MKKKTTLKLFVFSTVIMLFSFNHRLIQEEEIIPCQEITLKCLVLGREISGEHIIKNDIEYQNLINEKSNHSDCGNYQLSTIDFNQNTLIGYVSSIAGCNAPEIAHEILKTGNNYSINITINQMGLCERNNPVLFWCLIPKMVDSSSVIFKINKH